MTAMSVLLVIVGCNAWINGAKMDEPLFGLRYDPATVQFETAPPEILSACELQEMKTLWIYARYTTPEVDYIVLSGFLVVEPDGSLSGGPSYLQPSDSGVVVAVRGDRCEQGTPHRALAGQVVRTPRFTSVDLPEDVRRKLAADAVARYSRAFGGLRSFLDRIDYPKLERLALPRVLREAVDEAAEREALLRRGRK